MGGSILYQAQRFIRSLIMFISQCAHNIATLHGLPISLFLAGLAGGFTHCTMMCSPFVLAQTGGQPHLKKLSSALLMPYHLGRMTTYVGLAILINTIVNLAFVFSDLKTLLTAPLLLTAAVIFLVSAFPKLSHLFPWAANIHISAPYRFITGLSSRLIESPTVFKRYGLGVLLGFMPCGLVVSALLASATAPDAFHAALAMSAFTIGTMPALILVAVSGHSIQRKYPKASTRMRQGAMVLSSFWLLALAGIMVFKF